MEVTAVALAATDLRRRDELLDQLKTAWEDMSNEEWSAIEEVVKSIIHGRGLDNADLVSFPSLTEPELLERIDLSLAQADCGEYADADAFEKEIESEFGLV